MEGKLLYRKLDALFGALDMNQAPSEALASFLDLAFQGLRDVLRLSGGALYSEGRDGFVLQKEVGEIDGAVAESIEAARPPLSLVLRHRVYIFADPGAEGSPARLGLLPQRPAVGMQVGRRPHRQVIFFLLGDGWVREELDFTLNTLRAALGSRLRDERMRGSVEKAAEIQQSLLVEEPPEFAGFDLAARSVPAEEVGGDFYDFYDFGDEMLGIAIGDASGHGLPAALVVRDVVTGLRMGLEKELKIAFVFSKLNRVIHRSNLSSRFVSVFCGELEPGGNLIYVNAGHQPPLLFHEDAVTPLTAGGTVIGPLPDVRFRRGITFLPIGSVLVMCTDGILERRDSTGEFFGEHRLKGIVRESRSLSAEQLVDRLFDASFTFGDGRNWEDDATVAVIRRVS
jgi:sigma-B regulation protein RsbU (phosphoserine phosphatase)